MCVQRTTNPYVLSLDTGTPTAPCTGTERRPKKYKLFTSILFFGKDDDLVLVSNILRKWAGKQATREEKRWLEKFFMYLFTLHFTALDCPPITCEDLDFRYQGNGNFEPHSIQGIVGESAEGTEITWTFKIARDGSNQNLQITYEGDYLFKVSPE